MNSALKIGLIGGAAWFLFRDQLGVMFPSLFTAAATQPPPAAPQPAAPPAGVTPDSPATTKQRLLAWATPNDFYKQQGKMLNSWQWNYGYKAVRGTEPPPIEQMFPGQDPARLMTLDEYWTGIAGAGLSGTASGSSRRSAAAKAWRF